MHTGELSSAPRATITSPQQSAPCRDKPGISLVTLCLSLTLSLALAACGGNKEIVKGDNLALGALSIDSIDMTGADGGGSRAR